MTTEPKSLDSGNEPAGRGSGDPSRDLTALLNAWRAGRPGAGEEVAELIYPHLRRIVARELARHLRKPSLQVTDLLHETYVKLARPRASSDWQSRAHFFNFAAVAARRVLVDLARQRLTQKRQDEGTIALDQGVGASPTHPDLLDLNAALDRLGHVDRLAVRIVELRYFAGLTVEESADALGVGRSTVVRKWRYARAWLRDALGTRVV